jgi:hypothetical protein
MLKIAMIYLVAIAVTVLWWWLVNMVDPFWTWLFLIAVVSTGLLAVELLQTTAWRNTNAKLTKLIKMR